MFIELNHIWKNGGKEIIVKIDETKIEKCKYNRRPLIDGKLIFETYEKNNGRMFIVFVPERSRIADTLINVIKEWILPGTIIMLNCQKACKCLEKRRFWALCCQSLIKFCQFRNQYKILNIK